MAINRMESDFNGEGLRIGVVTARFNAEVTEAEEAACLAALTDLVVHAAGFGIHDR